MVEDHARNFNPKQYKVMYQGGIQMNSNRSYEGPIAKLKIIGLQKTLGNRIRNQKERNRVSVGRTENGVYTCVPNTCFSANVMKKFPSYYKNQKRFNNGSKRNIRGTQLARLNFVEM